MKPPSSPTWFRWGLYFSASWCPPCQYFVPILAQGYKAIRETHGTQADGERSQTFWGKAQDSLQTLLATEKCVEKAAWTAVCCVYTIFICIFSFLHAHCACDVYWNMLSLRVLKKRLGRFITIQPCGHTHIHTLLNMGAPKLDAMLRISCATFRLAIYILLFVIGYVYIIITSSPGAHHTQRSSKDYP